MENTKKFKRGQVLFKEGEAPQCIHLIQSGKVALMLERGGQRLEVATLGASQVLGEQALFSSARHPFTAEAVQECKVLEVPLDLMKQQFEKCPVGIKLMMKSLADDIRLARQQMKAARLESEKAPCPQGLIHRLFTLMHLIIRHIGKTDASAPETNIVSWNALKLYASRFFGESPQRLRNILDILLKLKLAEFAVTLDEEGEETLSDIRFHRVQMYEDFAEFYQYHLFKGGRSEAIYVDPLALKVAKAFVELSVMAEVDHKGASKLQYSDLLTECKSKFRLDLKNTHLDLLEKKGLFVSRKSFDDGHLELSFDRPEFTKMVDYWGIILEIDKWNESGFVNLREKESAENVGPAGACPQCAAEIKEEHKFCPNCGAKLAAA